MRKIWIVGYIISLLLIFRGYSQMHTLSNEFVISDADLIQGLGLIVIALITAVVSSAIFICDFVEFSKKE